MSKISISDLHRSESEYGLIDLSNDEQKAINGGAIIIIIIYSDGSADVIVIV